MSDSQDALQPCCCILYKKKSDELSTIAANEDSMELTSLLEKLNVNVPQSDVICPLCGGSIKSQQKSLQQCEKSVNKTHPSTSQESPPPPAKVWNTIIVNQIPVRINCIRLDPKELFSLFSQYGTIKDAYLCGSDEYPPKHEKVARITFNKEEDARKVWTASQEKMIKYDEHVLMITLISDDYSPIQDLPDDCLSKIFLHISSVHDKFNVELVCKRWESIGRECWSSVTTVDNYWKSRTWETIISRTTDSINCLKISINDEDENEMDEPEDSMKRLSLITEHLTHLETFAVTMYVKNNASINSQLRSIISNNQSLKRLGLWWVALNDGFIDLLPDGMEEIQINCNIRREHLQPYSIQTGPVNLSRFGNLQVLSLFNFSIGKNQLEGIQCLENLRVLKLKESRVHPSNINKIVNFTKLEHVAIPNCQISDVTLSMILKNNKGLKHLDISDIKKLTDLSFQHVFQLLHLKILLMKNLKKMTDKYFNAMPSLQQLNCNGCTSITDTGIQRLFTPDSLLEKLSIADCSITLETVKIASKWAPPEKKGFRIVFLNGQMADKWKNSGFEEPVRMATLGHVHVLIGPCEDRRFVDPVDDDWQEIFNGFD